MPAEGLLASTLCMQLHLCIYIQQSVTAQRTGLGLHERLLNAIFTLSLHFRTKDTSLYQLTLALYTFNLARKIYLARLL